VSRVLGGLRAHLGRKLELADTSRDAIFWVIDFPLFEWSEEDGRWTFSHHMFTGIKPGHEDLVETDPGAAVSQAYDLVWNGWELGSGSIRIHDQEVQGRVFRALGLSDAEARDKFGYLLEALRMGAPPHGGFAMGIERFVALLAGEPNIREIVPFPKVSSGSDPLTGAPTPMPKEILRELGIEAIAQPD
jgi:aspartyl-tRNA synthetase